MQRKCSIADRVQIVKHYYGHGCSPIKTVRSLQGVLDHVPSTAAIKQIINKFDSFGTVCSRKSERFRSARTAEIIAIVEESIKTDPGATTRERAKKLGISRTTLRRILLNDVKFELKDIDEFMDNTLIKKDFNADAVSVEQTKRNCDSLSEKCTESTEMV